jgi:predicted Zn-dependent peptidase
VQSLKGAMVVQDLQFQRISLGPVRLHLLPTDKFKTVTLVLLLEQELSEKKVTKTALLPSVLQRGTQKYPETMALQQKLQEMYGATLIGSVFKRGERHILQFGLDVVNEALLQEKNGLLEQGVTFLSEVLFTPAGEKGAFRPEYVQAEKQKLHQKIEALQDDKIRYAIKRLNEEMCKGEPYALYNYGRQEDLPAIDEQNLYTYYQEVLQQCPLDLYCVGNISQDEISLLLEKSMVPNFGTAVRHEVPNRPYTKRVQEVRRVEDRLDVKQGKLNLGCRTHVTVDDEAYPALLLYNGILGGFAHSKLFMNVREKESLAYYCSSRLESHLGLLLIQSGIEMANYDKALSIIEEQLDLIRAGEITEQELQKTKATLINQFRESLDSAYGLIDFAHHMRSAKREWTLDQLIEAVQQVSKEQIVQVAQNVELDTIYFLRDKGGADHGEN